MATLDLSATLGLIAVVALTVNALVGIAVWARLKLRYRALTPFRIHKWTGYAAAIVVLAHVLLIPLDPASGVRWVDLPLPIWTTHQPLANSLGAAAFWLLVVVVVSSMLQKRLGFERWRRLHYVGYAALPTLLLHGILTDPSLRDRAVDLLDAEKLLVEGAAVVLLAAIVFRWRRRGHPPGKRLATAASLLLFGIIARPAHADEPPPVGWHIDPDNGLVWTGGDLRFTTWGFLQGMLAEDGTPSWRRARQGMSVELPRLGPLRVAAVYEVDLTDNDFFRQGPAWKLFENAFVAVEDAGDANRLRALFGENTHILSREDNLSSGNLPTVNRSIVLESHGSLHAFGTQWGGQAHAAAGHGVSVAASIGDNTGSLNQDHPRFALANDFAGKLTLEAWRRPDGSSLTFEASSDYTRRVMGPELVIGSALGAAPVLHATVAGAKLTGEADAELVLAGAFPVRLETEWIASRFADPGTTVVGGYVQGLMQLHHADTRGDLSVFVRPELVHVRAGGASGDLDALRAGLDWNLPVTGQRASVLVEAAWHRAGGDLAVVMNAEPGFELRAMLRISATRHARF